MKHRCLYECGPYKGYYGRADYDSDDETFHGRVVGTRDVITFESADLKSLDDEFRKSVDVYLRFCQEKGRQPERVFSGKFVMRLPPDLHKRLRDIAAERGESLNSVATDYLQAAVEGERPVAHGKISRRGEPRRESAPVKVRRLPATRRAKR